MCSMWVGRHQQPGPAHFRGARASPWTRNISAGLMASYRGYTRRRGGWGLGGIRFLGLGAQGHYHFVDLAPPPFDFFAGLTLALACKAQASSGQAVQTRRAVDHGQRQRPVSNSPRTSAAATPIKDWTLFAQTDRGLSDERVYRWICHSRSNEELPCTTLLFAAALWHGLAHGHTETSARGRCSSTAGNF